jgi:predicted RND superfamily exporter protein
MHTRRIYLFIGFYMVLVFTMAWSASSLRFNGNLESLLPSENPHVQAYDKLKDLRSSEGGMDLVVKVGSESAEDVETFETADSLQVLAMEARLVEQAGRVAEFMMQDAAEEGGIAFSGVEWRSDLQDLRKNLFYLMTEQELEGIYKVIEEAIEEVKKEVNPFYFELESDGSEEASLSPSELIARYKTSSTLLTLIDNAIPYEWNPGEGTIIVRFLLPFKQSEIDLLGATYDRALDLANEYEMMHPDVQLYWGGDYVDHYYRIQGIREAVGEALWIGLLALFGFLWLYMRRVGKEGVLKAGDLVFDMALMLGILASGIVLSLGIYSFLQKEINLFAAIIFSVLVGMNLDYLLHMYAMIRRGEALSWRQTAPIRYSALTTTLAIASLMFADLDGFVQLGMIVTINVPIHLASCYLWLPFSAAARKGGAGSSDEAVPKAEISRGPEGSVGPVGSVGSLMRWGGVTLGLMLVMGAYFGLEHVEFNSDFNSLEPVTRTPDFREAARKIPEPNFVRESSFLLAPSKDSAKIFFTELKTRLNDSNRGDDLGYVDQVESLVGRMPSEAAEVERKRQKIEELQKLIAVNQEYMPGLEGDIQRYAEWALLAEVPTEYALPEYLLNRFSLRSGGLAPLILVYPNQNLSTGSSSLEYLENSGILYARDGTPYVLASTQLIAASVLKRLMADTRWVTIAPFLALFLVIFGIYRKVTWVIMALAPLVGTFLVLLSWNLLFTVPLHVYNVVVLPIIIGVSVDNGIHLVHSYQRHGKDFFEPFWSKVYPVLVGCSFTTVLGFVGLLFVNHPGMVDMGALAIGSISISVLVTLGYAMWLHSWMHRG